jgi:hypothetical protein
MRRWEAYACQVGWHIELLESLNDRRLARLESIRTMRHVDTARRRRIGPGEVDMADVKIKGCRLDRGLLRERLVRDVRDHGARIAHQVQDVFVSK